MSLPKPEHAFQYQNKIQNIVLYGLEPVHLTPESRYLVYTIGSKQRGLFQSLSRPQRSAPTFQPDTPTALRVLHSSILPLTHSPTMNSPDLCIPGDIKPLIQGDTNKDIDETIGQVLEWALWRILAGISTALVTTVVHPRIVEFLIDNPSENVAATVILFNLDIFTYVLLLLFLFDRKTPPWLNLRSLLALLDSDDLVNESPNESPVISPEKCSECDHCASMERVEFMPDTSCADVVDLAEFNPEASSTPQNTTSESLPDSILHQLNDTRVDELLEHGSQFVVREYHCDTPDFTFENTLPTPDTISASHLFESHDKVPGNVGHVFWVESSVNKEANSAIPEEDVQNQHSEPPSSHLPRQSSPFAAAAVVEDGPMGASDLDPQLSRRRSLVLDRQKLLEVLSRARTPSATAYSSTPVPAPSPVTQCKPEPEVKLATVEDKNVGAQAIVDPLPIPAALSSLPACSEIVSVKATEAAPQDPTDHVHRPISSEPAFTGKAEDKGFDSDEKVVLNDPTDHIDSSPLQGHEAPQNLQHHAVQPTSSSTFIISPQIQLEEPVPVQPASKSQRSQDVEPPKVLRRVSTNVQATIDRLVDSSRGLQASIHAPRPAIVATTCLPSEEKPLVVKRSFDPVIARPTGLKSLPSSLAFEKAKAAVQLQEPMKKAQTEPKSADSSGPGPETRSTNMSFSRLGASIWASSSPESPTADARVQEHASRPKPSVKSSANNVPTSAVLVSVNENSPAVSSNSDSPNPPTSPSTLCDPIKSSPSTMGTARLVLEFTPGTTKGMNEGLGGGTIHNSTPHIGNAVPSPIPLLTPKMGSTPLSVPPAPAKPRLQALSDGGVATLAPSMGKPLDCWEADKRLRTNSAVRSTSSQLQPFPGNDAPRSKNINREEGKHPIWVVTPSDMTEGFQSNAASGHRPDSAPQGSSAGSSAVSSGIPSASIAFSLFRKVFSRSADVKVVSNELDVANRSFEDDESLEGIEASIWAPGREKELAEATSKDREAPPRAAPWRSRTVSLKRARSAENWRARDAASNNGKQ